jgi:hypothetical protein
VTFTTWTIGRGRGCWLPLMMATSTPTNARTT